MADPSPFHEGEQRVQARLGVRDRVEPWARHVVRRFLPGEHRAFFAQLPFLVLAARDATGRPWATLLSEDPGFVVSPDPRTLRADAIPSPGDALADALRPGRDVGLLGIELHSRRRNRANGRIARAGAGGFTVRVDQSFGNCPQYITERSWRRVRPDARSGGAQRGRVLSPSQRDLVERSDTFFIASGYRDPGRQRESFGMDVSHRGGPCGFVRVGDARRLVFPDYPGNDHFNTLGNLVLDPRVGLVFVDFERGDLLQLTGRARIDWNAPESGNPEGTRRLVHVEIEEIVEARGALPLRWETTADPTRELCVVARQPESEDVTSFLLEARDGSPLPGFRAGQHLPLEIPLPGGVGTVVRTYSLSSAPDDPRYRISVKRHPRGRVSRHLHDRVDTGHVLSARAARGRFVLDERSSRPVVLASAGAGLTPLVSMLHALAREDGRPDARPVWFVHGARDGDHHPFRWELLRLAERATNVGLHVAYSRARSRDVAGRDYQSAGRIDGALLEKLVPGLEADFYVCGPRAFMAAIRGELEMRGVDPARVRSESFGPDAG